MKRAPRFLTFGPVACSNADISREDRQLPAPRLLATRLEPAVTLPILERRRQPIRRQRRERRVLANPTRAPREASAETRDEAVVGPTSSWPRPRGSGRRSRARSAPGRGSRPAARRAGPPVRGSRAGQGRPSWATWRAPGPPWAGFHLRDPGEPRAGLLGGNKGRGAQLGGKFGLTASQPEARGGDAGLCLGSTSARVATPPGANGAVGAVPGGDARGLLGPAPVLRNSIPARTIPGPGHGEPLPKVDRQGVRRPVPRAPSMTETRRLAAQRCLRHRPLPGRHQHLSLVLRLRTHPLTPTTDQDRRRHRPRGHRLAIFSNVR